MAMAKDMYKDATLPWTVDGGLVPTYCLVVRCSTNVKTTRSRLVSPCCPLTRPTPHLPSQRWQKHLQHFVFDNTVSTIHTSCRSESSKYKLGRLDNWLMVVVKICIWAICQEFWDKQSVQDTGRVWCGVLPEIKWFYLSIRITLLYKDPEHHSAGNFPLL